MTKSYFHTVDVLDKEAKSSEVGQQNPGVVKATQSGESGITPKRRG